MSKSKITQGTRNKALKPIMGNQTFGLGDKVYCMPSCPACGEVTYSMPECPFCGQPSILPARNIPSMLVKNVVAKIYYLLNRIVELQDKKKIKETFCDLNLIAIIPETLGMSLETMHCFSPFRHIRNYKLFFGPYEPTREYWITVAKGGVIGICQH